MLIRGRDIQSWIPHCVAGIVIYVAACMNTCTPSHLHTVFVYLYLCICICVFQKNREANAETRTSDVFEDDHQWS